MPPSAEAVQAVNDILHPKPDGVGYLGIPDGAGGYLYDMPFRPGSLYARVQLGIEFEIAEVRAGGIARDPDLKLNFFRKNGLLTAEDPNADGAVARFGANAGAAYVAPHPLSQHETAVANLDFGGFALLNGGAATFNASQGDKDFKVRGTTDDGLLFGDASTNRVGIGTTSPGTKLDVRGGVIINEDGLDVDFRVEGDSDSALLATDGTTDRVGIGTASPQAKLDVRGSATFNDDAANADFRVAGNADENLIRTDAIKNATGVGTNSGIEDSAKFQVDSTTKGLLIPRMTEAERDAITAPATSLLIFNTDTFLYNYWDGFAWVELAVSAPPSIGAAGAIGLVRTTTTITGDTSEHSLIGSSTLSGASDIPSNWLRQDRQVRGRFDVDTTGAAGFTLTFKFYVAGVAVVTSVVTPTADGALSVEFRIANVSGFSTIDYVAWMDVACPDVSGALVHTLVHNGGTALDVSGSPVPLDVTLTLGDASTSVETTLGSSFEFIEVATLT